MPKRPEKTGKKERVEEVVVEVLVENVCERSASLKEEERRLVRKLDWRIMPMLGLMYLFAALDRTNLGNARLQGLPQDILHGDPTGVLFDWANSAFYFSYVTCQVPALITSKLYPPRIWLGCTVIGWGLVSTLMATTSNFPSLMVARLALGAFEAGFSPGFPLYLSLFYTREEFGLRTAGWYMFAAVAGAFGGLVAFGIQHVHAAVANWRLLFIVEGIPSILLGILALVILPDRPEETPVLTEREREIAVERMNRGGSADVGRRIQKKHIPIAFRDWKIYAAGVMFFAGNCALSGIQGFLPTIIASFGFTNAIAQILTVPPYAVAALILCVTTYASDRMQRRGVFLFGVNTLAGVGYILLLTVPFNIHVRYLATFCTTAGTISTIAVILTWFSHNLGSETKRAAGMPLYMSIGHCGSILGSHLFPTTDAPRYLKGFAVTCGLIFLCATIALAVSGYYTWENRRRDHMYGKPNHATPVDVSELADEAPNFRYTP
ncbi:MFS general substrate transporter [Dichomitus squalens LYAD-421 SS1]|uniref:MFS general substrate transporter n=1 Tax=Dichomitus squalens (strain LYAD-421) TaxID=732165 RepID=R7SQT7_DICSQ|nr:MFS general substrate transporter [Dichomitus squalens LYAD-421 SS1]EJF57327.1 MFS general substrate transporter [Dichomitus squalens LYAD-421 SS1]